MENERDHRNDMAPRVEAFNGHGTEYSSEPNATSEPSIPALDLEIERTRFEIEEWEGLLKDAGPLRRAWLKLTRQIPKDPERELDLSKLYVQDMQDSRDQAAGEQQAHEESRRDLMRMRRSMSAEEANIYLELMEDNGVKPLPELYRRAGRLVPERKVGDTTVPGFVNDNLPSEVDADAPSFDDDPDFGPSF
jgi:hypothetical protein